MIYPEKGYIGCFEMADRDSGKRQLEGFARQLKETGHPKIIAPIDGDTWHAYRLVSFSDGTPPFPMEPRNPLWYNEVYTDAGFKPLKKYRSDAFEIGDFAPAKGAAEIRGFREDDLPLLYRLSIQGFSGNFLYEEIPFAGFAELYSPFLPMIDSSLVVVAEVGGAPAGFIFSFAAGDALILKTMAVLPEYRSRGIGAQLISRVLQSGREKGLSTAIAALMADDSNSHKIVKKYNSRKIREYTLYCFHFVSDCPAPH